MACRPALQRSVINSLASTRARSSSFLPALNIPIPVSSAHHRQALKLRIHAMTTKSQSTTTFQPEKENSPHEQWRIKMLYDGDCPLCMREVEMLRERNKRYGSIKFVDISSDDYSPDDNQGLDYETVMGRIHAIQNDGTVFTDVDAFRRLYEEIGLGWLYAVTKYEPMHTIANAVYGLWAKYRLQITGRPPLEQVVLSRKGGKVSTCADNGDSCEVKDGQRKS